MEGSYLYTMPSLASALWPWFITYAHKTRKMPCSYDWKRQRGSDSRAVYDSAEPYYAELDYYINIES